MPVKVSCWLPYCLNRGGEGADFTIIGIPCKDETLPSERMRTVEYGIAVPKMLSFLGYHDFNAYIPGVEDILNGYTSHEGETYPSVEQRMANGRKAIAALGTYKTAVEAGNDTLAAQSLGTLREHFGDFGYGYLESPDEIIPNIPLVFYSFRIMVGLGMLPSFASPAPTSPRNAAG